MRALQCVRSNHPYSCLPTDLNDVVALEANVETHIPLGFA